MISLNDVLLAMANIPVDDPIAEIWGRGLQGGYKIIEYTGSLPITISANGDALLDYRIYGADGWVGEPTENLIDASLSEQTIEIKPSTSYAISRYVDTPGQSASDLRFGVYDENDVLLWSDYLGTWWGETIKVYDNAKYFKITIPNRYLNCVSLVEGTRPAGLSTRDPYPANYIPYGYKLPMVTMSENLFDAQGTDNYGYYDNVSGEYVNDRNYKHWRFHVKEGDVIRWTKTGAGYGCCFLNGVYKLRIYNTSTPYTIPGDVDEITNNFASNVWESAMVTKNQPLPDQYVPYSRTDTPVYIGENQLGAGEYVSYGEQKIYKLVGEGVDPVNLFDEDSEDIMTGYEIIGGGVRANSLWLISERIPVVSGYKYIKEIFGNAILQYVSYNDENPTRTSFSGNAYIVPNNVRYIRINCLIANKTTAKFYRNLSPTAPPVPLPEIPTIDGTTVVDYDGDPTPSQMYIKYKG